MLTTDDVYKNSCYAFELGDMVRFRLMRGLELRIFEKYGRTGIVQRSENRNSNRTITGMVTDYGPLGQKDLGIRCIIEDGRDVYFRLSQCRNLQVLDLKLI